MELDELEKRLEVLKDIEEIKKLHREYIYWHNSEEWDKMIECFTDTAAIEIANHSIRKGKEEIASFFWDIIAKSKRAKGAHILIQPVITVEGEKATGKWIMEHFFYDADGGQAAAWGQGKYESEYIKKDGKWKFSLLKFIRPWPEPKAKS